VDTKKISILLFLSAFLLPLHSHAATLMFQNQDQSTEFRLLDNLSGGSAQEAYQTFTALETGPITGWQFYLGQGGSNITQFQIQVRLESDDSFVCRGPLTDVSNGPTYFAEIPTGGDTALMTWPTVTPTFLPCDSATLTQGTQYRVYFRASRDGAFQDGELFVRGTPTSSWYFRAFTDGLPPPAPVTEFNEVLNYIPDTGVSTTTGTTTVGATFSIPSPDFIEYIGYRLYSPSNEILFDATTTPSDAGIYEISTDYNFTDVGIYQGHAYFAQDVGGNIWQVDNPTVQQILVDVVEWTVDPTGGFSQNPATTSTTTLPNLTLDCGDGFASSVCNLVARLVIPSASSIALVQAQWSLVLSKAPFSFFTESRAILQAVRANSGTQQSLSLNMFGVTFPVIATSTAAAIGLDTAQINFAKFLMIVGLWILFAWFLYWRIASIFGV